MKKKKAVTVAIVLAVIEYLIIATIYNNTMSKTVSIEITKEFLQTNLTSALEPKYDVEEVLYAKKFTKNESLFIALVKDSKGIPWVYSAWDGWSRYCKGIYFSIADLTNFNDPYDYIIINDTEFGEPYICIFQNPEQDSITVNGAEHEVFRFDCTIDGIDYSCGFYCGLLENEQRKAA